jgi:YVTN family beta-propeller protein
LKLLFAPLLAILVCLFAPPARCAVDTPAATLPDVPIGPSGRAVLLPNGWQLTPAGRAIPLPGDMPTGMAISPDGKFLLVNTAGWHDQDIDVIDLAAGKASQSVDVDKDWGSLCFNHAGDEVWLASGQGYDRSLLNAGAENGMSPNRLAAMQKSVLRFAWKNDFLMPKPALTVPLLEGKERWTAGLADGPDGSLYVLAMEDDLILRLAAGSRETLAVGQTGYRPAAVSVSSDGETVAVANWGGETVSLLNAQTLQPRAVVQVGSHPDALVWGKDGRLFVANADSDSVSIIRGERVAETVETSIEPQDLVGATPDALALTPDESRLYVADAGSNAVAVVDTSDSAHSHVLGFIPTDWYPTALAVSPDGNTLYVGAGKGLRSRPNVPAIAPDPRMTEDGQRKFDDIGRVMSGAVSVVNVPDPAQLAAYTRQVRANIPVAVAAGVDMGLPSPPSEIKHVLYIIRQGRTYDQVFGDIPSGNGDPSLALYGRYVTPNAHALAQEFVLLDNLYCNGEAAEDGRAWTDSAYATDFIEKAMPSSESGRDEPDADSRLRASPAGNLWDDCSEHGITYYSYGEQAHYEPLPNGSYLFRGDRSLVGHSSVDWSLIPPDRHDNERADVFLKDLRDAQKTGRWPQLVVMSLDEDATQGAEPGKYSPLAHIAANDEALGRVVQGMTRSRFWPSTAIFVIERDARDGPDHVDAHRTVGLVISPFIQRHTIDSTLYTTASFLRTIEMILGLPPMTDYDAHAASLLGCFTLQPTMTKYNMTAPRVDIEAKTPGP